MKSNQLQALAILTGILVAAQGQAQDAISADGVVESKSGGFKFPDGTVQVTAAGSADPCPTMDPSDEMIWVAGVCIDKYEASIWDAPVGGNQIIGTTATDYCNPNGQDCTGIYARSVVGVEPAANVTWFQAQQALANSGKRLPTNGEWQMVVAGTPDSTACNINTASVANTGTHGSCLSNHGAHDMVGNLWEWVADWDEQADNCASWTSTLGFDLVCFGQDGLDNRSPAAFIRGGDFDEGSGAGPFASNAANPPENSLARVGFRGAR